MAYRRFKWMLSAMSVAVVAVGLVAAGVIYLAEPPSEKTVPPRRHRSVAGKTAHGEPKIDLAAFDGLAEQRLQNPLTDPAPAKLVQKPAPAPPPPVDAVLLGTAVEQSRPKLSIAWVRYTSENKSLTIRIGDQLAVVGRPTVQSIEEGIVVLDFGDRQQELRMQSQHP